MSAANHDIGDLDLLIECSARVFGLTVQPEWRDAVRRHLAIVLDHAGNVAAFPLPDDLDPAPIFTP